MTREELSPTVKELLAAALPALPVFVDDGSNAVSQAMEAILQDEAQGACLAIGPILESKPAEAPVRNAFRETATFAISVRMNPDAHGEAAHQRIVTAVQRALLAGNLATKVFVPATPSTRLIPEDIGCLTTAAYFTASIVTVTNA